MVILSYSKIKAFEKCPFQYYLHYVLKNYISSITLASELGDTIHYCEKVIGDALKDGKSINYFNLRRKFYQEILPNVKNINTLKSIYRSEFIAPNTYEQKVQRYFDYGVMNLQKFLHNNPQYGVMGGEIEIFTDIGGFLFKGTVDRILYAPKTGQYLIQDLKTRGGLFSKEEMDLPLQLIIYKKALAEMQNVSYKKINCQFNLLFVEKLQTVNSVNYMERGIQRIEEICDALRQAMETNTWIPNPCAHNCGWCAYSKNATGKGRGMCPFSK